MNPHNPVLAQGFGVATSAINYAPCLVRYHESLYCESAA